MKASDATLDSSHQVTKIKRDLSAGKTSKVKINANPNLMICLTAVSAAKPAYAKLSAHLETLSPAQRVPNIRITRTCSRKEVLQLDIDTLCRMALSQFKSNQASAPSVPASKNVVALAEQFRTGIEKIPNLYSPASYNVKGVRSWNKQTTEDSVKYILNTMGKFFAEHHMNPSPDDYEKFFDLSAAEIAEKAIKRKLPEWTPNDASLSPAKYEQFLANAAQNLTARWKRASRVLTYIQRMRAELNLTFPCPTEPISLQPCLTATAPEQIKSLPDEIYVKCCTLLLRLCELGIPAAYASICEVLVGMRISESCAPLIGDFEVFPNYVRLFVKYQITDKGERLIYLKTDASYRYVYFGDFFLRLLNLRKSQLAAKGFTAEEISEMPLASPDESPRCFLIPDSVLPFVKKLLTAAGCDKNWVMTAEYLLFQASGLFGLDPTSHTCRRALVTYWLNRGIPLSIVDELVGHKNSDRGHYDFASPEFGSTVAALMERTRYLGSLCQCLNPAFVPQPLSGHHTILLKGNHRYQFVAEQDGWLELNVNTLECRDDLLIDSNMELSLDDLNAQYITDTLTSRRTRPILAPLPTEDTVEKWIQEAQEMDLSAFLHL